MARVRRLSRATYRGGDRSRIIATGNRSKAILWGRRAGTAALGNSDEGILIEAAFGNTIGGTTSTASNVISANEWGIRIDRADRDGQCHRGELHRYGLDRHYRSGQRDQWRHLQYQCIEQHRWRHERRPGKHDRLQRRRRRSCPVRDRRFDAFKQRLSNGQSGVC